MQATQPTPMDVVTKRAFERTVSTHYAAMGRRALRLAGSEAAAADLVQDALVRACRFWHTFDPGTNAKAWLFTILRNTWLSQCKRASRERRVLDTHTECADWMEPAPMPGAADATDAHESRQRVREAVESLPESYREAVRLVDLEGASYREAAEALGCAQGTVMSRLYRGRKRLAAALAA